MAGEEAKAPRRGLRRVVTWAIVGLLVLCVGTMLLAQVGGQQAVEEGWTATPRAVADTATVAPSATAEPAATDTPEPTALPTATRTPRPTAAPSGGIGLGLAEWDARGHRRGEADGSFYDYDAGKFWVGLLFDGRLCHLERTFAGSGVSLDTARRGMALLLPEDAELVETYSPPDRPEAVVDLYRSAWLEGRFTTDVWTGSEPGQFIVLYKVFDDLVARAIVGCGNNP